MRGMKVMLSIVGECKMRSMCERKLDDNMYVYF